MQFCWFDTFTLLFEPEPLPSIIMVVPDPDGDALGDGELDGVGLADGVGDADGFGVPDGDGLPEGVGDVEGFGDAVGDGIIEGEGLGKLAAAVKRLPRFPALLEKRPKTDWFRANNIRVIKNDVKKYAFLILSVVVANLSS